MCRVFVGTDFSTFSGLVPRLRGYIGAPEYIARACNKIQGQITSGANCIAQRATITALKAPVSKIRYMIDKFKERRSLILNLLNEVEGFKCNEPEGAFYVFPNVSELSLLEELRKHLNKLEACNLCTISIF